MTLPAPPRDPGLQAERTALAWNRTGLAFLANGALVLRAGWVSQQRAVMLLAALLIAASAATCVYGAWRRHRLLAQASPVPPAVVGVTAIVTLLACLAALFGIATLRA